VTVLLVTVVALIVEIAVLMLLWRIVREHLWSASALFALGAFAAFILAALPASWAASSVARWVVVAVVVAPVPVATILKAVRSGRRQADGTSSRRGEGV
jgi:hypothetical protein